MRVASAFLILIGLLWAFGLWWMDAVMNGIAERMPQHTSTGALPERSLVQFF